MRRARGRDARFLAVALLLLAGGPSCAHDDAPESAATAGPAIEESAPDRLEAMLEPADEEADDAELPVEAGRSAPHPGKVERRQEQSRVSRYESVTGVRGAGRDEEEDGASNELIRLEAASYGTPGLVLVRAMSGAQTMGYTVLELDERDFYFIALKNPSFLQGLTGSGRGVCKIAVGTEASADGGMTKVALKARAGTGAARPYCEKDLEKILKYARGELSDRPKKRERVPWLRDAKP